MIFDPAQIQRGARLKRSPYFEATQRAGCRGYTVYNHMLLPIRYDSLRGGVPAAARRRDALGRVGRAQRRDRRPDGARFAELLTPRDFPMCGRRRPLRHPHRRGRWHRQRPGAAAPGREPLLARVRRQRRAALGEGVVRGSGMQVELRELDVAPLQVQGPKSRQLVTDLFGSRVERLATTISSKPSSKASR